MEETQSPGFEPKFMRKFQERSKFFLKYQKFGELSAVSSNSINYGMLNSKSIVRKRSLTKGEKFGLSFVKSNKEKSVFLLNRL